MNSIDFTAYSEAANWNSLPDEVRNAKFERTIELSRFPGVLLPAMVDGKVCWYVIAGTAPEWRLIKPILTAYVGETISTFSGEPSQLDTTIPIEKYIASVAPYVVARLTVPANMQQFALRALSRLVSSLEEKPVDLRPPPISTAKMITNFDMCLVQGDRKGAEQWLKRFREELRLDTINLNFAKIRMEAAFRDWKSIVQALTFREACRVHKPLMVSRHLLEAMWHYFLEPVASDKNALEDAYRQECKTAVEEIFASGPGLSGEVVDKFSPFGGFTKQEVVKTEDVDVSDAEQQITGQIRGDAEAVQPNVAVDFENSQSPSLEVVPLEGELKESLLSDTPSFTTDNLEDWGEWIKALEEPSFRTSKSCAEEMSLTHLAEAYEDPSDIAGLATALTSTGSDDAYQRLMLAFPIFINWVRTDPGYPRKAMRPVYEALLTLNALRDDYGSAEREAASELLSALLDIGVSEEVYHQLLQDISSFIPGGAGTSDVFWLLDLADILCRYSAVKEDDRNLVLNKVLSSLTPILMNLSPIQRKAYRRIADIGGWPPCPDDENEEQATISDLLNGKLVGIYTLTEQAGRQAVETLKNLAPNVKVEVSSDHVCTSKLKSLSKNADIFVVTSTSAKHAATDCINQNRPPKKLLYAAGRGCGSILRSIEESL
jgi:hypothetical protein